MERRLTFGEAPAIDRYKSCFESPSRPLPSIQQIKSAISTLNNDPRSATLDVLEDIMMLRYRPECFDILTGPVIPSCIAVLERFENHGRILNHKIAVVALQLLSFSIALGVLLRNNYHDKFIESLRSERESGYLPSLRCDISMHVITHMSIMMEDYAKRGTQEKSRGLGATHGLLGWTLDGQYTCLEELGGFTKHDTRFLLHYLWIQRDGVMELFRDVYLPGFTLVIHVMWKHMACLLEQGTKIMQNQLRELVIRYSFVSTSLEDPVLYRHFLDLRDYVHERTIAGPVNRSDQIMVVSSCAFKLNPPKGWVGAVEQIPLDFATDLMDILARDITETQEFDLFLPLLEAGFTRLWFDLSKVPEDETVKWIGVIPLAYQLFQITQMVILFSRDPAFRNRIATSSILSMLLRSDLIDLFGRLCLMPMLLEDIPPGVKNGEEVDVENCVWTDLSAITELLKTMSRFPPGYPTDYIHSFFASYESDWLKTYCFLRQLDGQLTAPHPLRRWRNVCVSMWTKLGKVWVFPPPIKQCIYARCPGAGQLPEIMGTLACMRCHEGVYCSSRCQEGCVVSSSICLVR
ncbi:hypothetical protein FRC12_014240 [Ceratobasidium sp. 428]|nr:hypothetical protein FRC12_014240 [Ceratobasidium sp. 428]